MTETFAGMSLPGHLHTQESLRFASSFQFRDTDVVIATYPKSGKSRSLADPVPAAKGRDPAPQPSRGHR